MDEDLEGMSREQLTAEVRKLRAGIRAHRDSTGHELLLASSGAVGPPAGEAGSAADGAGVAGVHPRLREISPITRRAGTQRTAHYPALRSLSTYQCPAP